MCVHEERDVRASVAIRKGHSRKGYYQKGTIVLVRLTHRVVLVRRTAHFLEHMAFKGTHTQTQRDLELQVGDGGEGCVQLDVYVSGCVGESL